MFKIWEEGKAPDVVIEVTSRSTRRHDSIYKARVYAEIGVKEYFLYDPTGDYLLPPLKGFRWVEGGYREMAPDESGALACQELRLGLRLEAGRLVIYDWHSGQPLLTEAEAERQAREAAEERAEGEAAAHRAVEEELRRLRGRIGATGLTLTR